MVLSFRARTGALVLITSLTASSALAVLRPLPVKPVRTHLSGGRLDDRVVVKFARLSGIRLDGAELVSHSEAETRALNDILRRYGAAAAPLFDLTPAAIDELRAEAEANTGTPLPDLNLYFQLDMAMPEAVELCDALNAEPLVELAYPAPAPAPPPGDHPPESGDCRDAQGHLGPAPEGIDARYGWHFPGGRGEGVQVIDIEYDWYDEHEDLERARGRKLVYTPGGLYRDHGTAVLGELVATDDRWGVTGLVPDVDIGMVTHFPAGGDYNVARATLAATALIGPGDVILLEAQTYGPAWVLSPVEWDQAVFDTIAIATASGRVVVEAAGNGGADLDGPQFLGLFDRTERDSGAILVGAGYSPTGAQPDRSRKDFSNHGSRVDLQGWGESVATTGYDNSCGGLWGDPLQTYSLDFGGTSSASPMVVAAVATLQGIRAASGAAPLRAFEVAALLRQTGVAQQAGLYAGNIGPRPDIRGAIRRMLGEIVFEDHGIDETPPGGDGDGIIEPGESVALSVCVHNARASQATGVVIRVVDPGVPWLKLIDDERELGALAPGGVGCAPAPNYRMVVEPWAPCDVDVRLGLEITSDAGVETTSAVRLTIGRDGVCEPHTCADVPPVLSPRVLAARAGASDLRLAWGEIPGAEDYRVWRSTERDFSSERFAFRPLPIIEPIALLADELDRAENLTFYRVAGINECGWEGE